MKSMVYKKHLKKEGKLEMAPMVDIVFQLLIFFLVATEMRPTESDFKTNLPGQGQGPQDMEKKKKPDVHRVFLESSDKGKAVFVTLDNYKKLGYMRAEKNEAVLQGKAFQKLEDALKSAVKVGDMETFMLVINGTKDTRIKFIAGALDAAVAAGVPKITFRGLNK